MILIDLKALARFSWHPTSYFPSMPLWKEPQSLCHCHSNFTIGVKDPLLSTLWLQGLTRKSLELSKKRLDSTERGGRRGARRTGKTMSRPYCWGTWPLAQKRKLTCLLTPRVLALPLTKAPVPQEGKGLVKETLLKITACFFYGMYFI